MNKNVIFHKRAKEVIKGFSKAVRSEIGELLFDLQRGENIGMPAARPMPTIAVGASELRVKDADGIYRVFLLLEIGRRHSCLSRVRKENTNDAAERN